MARLAYLTRWQWAAGFRMTENSRVAHDWLAGSQHWLAMGKRTELASGFCDGDAAALISPAATRLGVVEFQELASIRRPQGHLTDPVIFLHPSRDDEAALVRNLVECEYVADALVVVWSEQDMVRFWLEATSATNLLPSTPSARADALTIRACEAFLLEEYNGLDQGYGKDAVVQALTAMHKAGFGLVPEYWLRATLAAGGSIESARSVARFAKEINEGRRHRVNPRFREDILAVWRAEVQGDQGRPVTRQETATPRGVGARP